MIKKSLVSELPGPSSQTFVLVRVNEGDRLIEVALSRTKQRTSCSSPGRAWRSASREEVRPMDGRSGCERLEAGG